MSYQSWIFDTGHEVDSALRLYLGEELGEHDFNPDPRVVAAVADFTTRYHAHNDRCMIAAMADRFGTMGVLVPDDPRANISKEMKAHFAVYIVDLEIDDSSVFRWWMANTNLAGDAIGGDGMRLAFNTHWCAEFASLLGFIVKHAMERDSADDDYYDAEKDGSFDFDE